MPRPPLHPNVASVVWARRAPLPALKPETLSSTVIVVCAMLAGGFASDVAAHGDVAAVAALVGLGAYVFVLVLVPVRSLAVISLLTTLLVPMSSSLLPLSVQDTAVGVIPLAVWFAREPPQPGRRASTYLLGTAFLAWILFAEAAAPLHTRRGFEWLVTAGVCLSGACIRQPLMRDPTIVRRWFLRITTAGACYAVVEGFLLHRNVAFAFLFRGTQWWAPQHASVSYRVTTIFGHPLVNGLVFAVGGTFAAADFSRAVSGRRLRFCAYSFLSRLCSPHTRAGRRSASASESYSCSFSSHRSITQGVRGERCSPRAPSWRRW